MGFITVLSSWLLSLALAFAQLDAPRRDRFAMLGQPAPGVARTETANAAGGTSCLRCHK